VTISRRSFLQLVAGGSLCLAEDNATGAKPLRGVFPIAQTPFTDSDKLDLDALLEQLRFIHRGGVHGFVWPQLASEWASLTEPERMAGAEALGAAAKKLRPALVLGVQAPDAEAAVRYAIHAKKVGADAIISLPPPGQTDPKTIAAYYQQVGTATDLPLFVQAVGNMSVATLVEMYKSIPTFRYLKDEAGEPLFRIRELREQTGGDLRIFTGSHGRTMIDEMNRGTSGTMPAASFADLYAIAWESWQAGNHHAAMEMFGRISMLISEVNVYGIESLKYILQLRGVFQNCRTRDSGHSHLDDKGKEIIRQMMEEVKPWLRANPAEARRTIRILPSTVKS
jgi:4-hydroxy-tetrahydrodipicolinate synthase